MKKQAVLVFPKILIIPLSILLFAKSASAAGPHRPPRSGDQSPLNFSDIGSSSLMTSSGAGHGEMTGDKLVLRGLKFHGYHGVKEEERKLGQKFLVDVDAWMDLQPAGNSDCLSDTISYTAIYRIVKEVMEGAPHNLLESVTQSIASTILDKFPQISTVRIVLGKPHVAVLGSVDYLGVEIVRHRNKVVQS